MRKIVLAFLLFSNLLIVLPALLVLLYSGTTTTDSANTSTETVEVERTEREPAPDRPEVVIPVYRDAQETVEQVELEEYVAGVVAAEMPSQFEMEALKAQALVARTFVMKQLEASEDLQLSGDALVTDTTDHQVYKSDEEWKQEWGESYEEQMERVKAAVEATAGEIITHEGAPITASFFSTSNGYTENAEDYWETSLPYLQSVESPWDINSPRYENTLRLSVTEVEQQLNVTLPEEENFAPISARTEGGRVAEVTIAESAYHGREIREALGLDSSDFEWRREGNEIVIETRGWGHGVGMSQYGADGMAKDGKSYEEIVAHYYQDVTIQEDHQYMEVLAMHQDSDES